MNFFGFIAFRSVALIFATTASIGVVMVWLNIITVNDIVVILKLHKGTEECRTIYENEGKVEEACWSSAATAINTINENFQKVGGNILDILSQLLGKMFGWAGMEVDLSKIKVDVHKDPAPPLDAIGN